MGIIGPYFVVLNLVVASGLDCWYRKIPNVFVLLVLIGSFTIYIFEKGDGRCWWVFVLAFVISFPLYLLGGVGAGDVKLYTALSILFSLKGMLLFGFYSLLAVAIYGGIWKLVTAGRGRQRVVMAPGMLLGACILFMTGGM